MNEMDDLISTAMSAEHFNAPDISLVNAARKKVMSRKKSEPAERFSFVERLFGWMNLQVKFYHLGVSVLLAFAGYIYLDDRAYTGSNASDLINLHADMSIHNATVSVTSSTMLTSIPTLNGN